jgi:hypothetical protein
MGRQVKERAERTHCKSGHELSDDNVRILNKGSGRKYKQCLTCKPGEIGTRSEASRTYERPAGSRMELAMSRGVFGDGMTRADIMRNRS